MRAPRPGLMLAVAVLLLGVAGRAEGAFRAFVEIRTAATVAAGSTTDLLYAGWIDVQSFSQGETNAKTSLPGSPSRAALPPFSLVKGVDQATPVLADLLFRGVTDVSFHLVVASDSPGRIELWDFRCSPAAITAQSFQGDQSGTLVETLTITPGALEVAYIVTNPANGSALRELFASFNLVTGATTSGTRAPWYRGDIDSDGDGIPNSVELFYGLNPFSATDANLDSDGDGMTNLQEFVAGTNPKVPNSSFKVTQVLRPSSNTTQLTWSSEVGRVYEVQSATTLAGPFTAVSTVLSAGSGTTSAVVPNPGPVRSFFRVRVVP